MQPGDRSVIEAVQQHARDEVGSGPVEASVFRRFEQDASAVRKHFEGAGAGMGVTEPAIAARETNPALRGKLDIGDDLSVAAPGKRTLVQHPIGRATMGVRQFREGDLGAKASAKNEIVGHANAF